MLRCMDCMEELGNRSTCPFCHREVTNEPQSPLHLPLGTLLAERYTVGCAIGGGGFSFVYVAWDNQLNLKVAIKEWFPLGFVTRIPSTTRVLTANPHDSGRKREAIELFLHEGQMLAQLREQEKGATGLVSVFGAFEENDTAYIVMEYLDGITLAKWVDDQGGKVPWEKASRIMEPLISNLEIVHRHHILHRDVSLDNIILLTSGYLKLIDFGSARYITGKVTRSMELFLKEGYSPPEQYLTHGNIGPWTDVYAVGASLYRMVTGSLPPVSLERQQRDELRKPSDLGVIMPREAERAILKALALQESKRFQSLGDFLAALKKRYLRDVLREKQWVPIAAAIAFCAVILMVVFLWTAHPGSPVQDGASDLSSSPAGQTGGEQDSRPSASAQQTPSLEGHRHTSEALTEGDDKANHGRYDDAIKAYTRAFQYAGNDVAIRSEIQEKIDRARKAKATEAADGTLRQ